ncbi:MAG: hypothetical protein J2P41_16700, partial [Blastocatellia bacterium]|nr:hypothetical protein [Blastocatellia bacterium]
YLARSLLNVGHDGEWNHLIHSHRIKMFKVLMEAIGNMRKINIIAFTLTALVGLSSMAAAQTGQIDQREQRQQKRVASGIANGSISSGEAARIERNEAKIQRDEARAKSDGVVTGRERARLNRELNHTNNEIRHDSRNTPGIDKREQRQQNRVANGVRNGSLTPHETEKIERDEAKIRRDEARAKSDGVVTGREKEKLNRELNHTNREIYRDKHNGRHQ